MSTSRTENLAAAHGSKAPLVAIAGGALLILSGFLSWSYDDRILDDISIRFYPAGIQIYAMALGIVALGFGVLLLRRPAWMDPGKGLRILGVASVIFVLGALIAIAKQAGGIVNANEGLWVALVGLRARRRRRVPLPSRSTSTCASGRD